MSSTEQPPGWSQITEINREVIAEIRATGRVSRFPTAPIVLITTKGARTGREQIVPLGYTRDDDDVVIIAAKGGSPYNPSWYYNLRANPIVTVELPGEAYQAEAILTEGTERTRLFDAQAAQIPIFAEYQTQTTREIPVFVLRRQPSAM